MRKLICAEEALIKLDSVIARNRVTKQSRGSPRMFVYRPRWLPNGSHVAALLAMTLFGVALMRK